MSDSHNIVYSFADSIPLVDLSHYSGSKCSLEEQRLWKIEIERRMAQGEPVYVSFDDAKRAGSIGKLARIEITENSSKDWTTGKTYTYFSIHNIEVTWDKRSNKVKPYSYELIWHPNHTDGTIWAWTPPPPPVEKPPRVIPYDHLGEEIIEGQFVSFVHRRYKNIDLKFGTVSRLTDKGSVYVKILKLRDHDFVEEVKALSADDVVILNDQLMNRLMIARMAAN